MHADTESNLEKIHRDKNTSVVLLINLYCIDGKL